MLKIPANSLRNTTFFRLVVTYLFVILPIILLGVYLYNWSYKNASQEISKNNLTQLSTYLDNLNREIEWLEIQQYDLLQDEELNKLAVTWQMMSSVEKKEGMYYLQPQLASIKNSTPYIKDVYVHIPSINKTVSALNSVHDFEAEQYADIRNRIEKRESRLSRIKDSLYLGASKAAGKKGDSPLFVVEIELDMDKLKDSLNQITRYPGSGAFLISESLEFQLANNQKSYSIMEDYIEKKKSVGNTSLSVDIAGSKYLIDETYSENLELSVITYLPEEAVKRPLHKFNIWAWLFLGTSVVAILIYAFSTYMFVHKPLLLLIQSFRKMEGGSLDIPIVHEQKDEFGYLYDRFNHMLIKLKHLIDQDYKQKLMMQKAELKQLQSQINPHFLYNSFFILSSLAKNGDNDRIESFTNMLGEYFRFITRNGEDDVLLSEEIRHSRMYTEIQKLRFSRRIRVQFDELPEEMNQIRVPRLIIQPIVENAYEHSLEQMPEDGFLRVTFRMHAEEALIIVEDNGDSLSDSAIEALTNQLTSANESHEITGIINIHRRILLTYGEGSGVFLSRSELNGLQVVIRIKLTEEDWDV